MYAKTVVLAASCVETARIMLNSKSRHWPNGIANSSGQVGRNLCDHLYGTTGTGYLPQLLGQPAFPDNIPRRRSSGCLAGRTSRTRARRNTFAGTPSIPRAGAATTPITPGGSRVSAPSSSVTSSGTTGRRSASIQTPYPPCRQDQLRGDRPRGEGHLRDPRRADQLPVGRERAHMWEQAKGVCTEVIKASGGEYWGHGERPEMPGYSLHETGTCRMGDDPKTSVTNGFGQTHDVPNLYAATRASSATARTRRRRFPSSRSPSEHAPYRHHRELS